jgi:pimeloyl-ACP methyl ester carboxylesterase
VNERHGEERRRHKARSQTWPPGGCRGERDDSSFRPSDLLIGEIRDAVGDLDLHRIPRAGHWSAYENAGEVNRLMLEFFSS